MSRADILAKYRATADGDKLNEAKLEAATLCVDFGAGVTRVDCVAERQRAVDAAASAERLERLDAKIAVCDEMLAAS